jgi:hypothetical protein
VIPRRIGIVAWHGIGVFRRQNDTLAMSLDELTHEFFARAAGVEISRVNEISARVPVRLIDFLRFVLR